MFTMAGQLGKWGSVIIFGIAGAVFGYTDYLLHGRARLYDWTIMKPKYPPLDDKSKEETPIWPYPPPKN